MITHYYRTLKNSELKITPEPRAGTWTHAVAPTEEEREKLVALYKLDPSIVDDITDFFEVPRFEREDNVSYFFTRYPFDERDEDIDTAPLLIIIGPSYVVTVAQREVPFLEPFINGTTAVYTTQKTKFFIQLMDALTKAYDRELTRMRRAVYRDRTRVRDIRARDIQRLVTYEHQLNDIISAMVPTNGWIKQLSDGHHIELHQEDRELLEDLIIANSQLVESTKSVLKTIQNIRNATESILSQRLNKTIQLLTALTIILTIPTIIASLYGMNVPLPLADHPQAFWIVLGVIGAIAALVTNYFRRQQWF